MGERTCLNCIYLATNPIKGYGVCAYEPAIPACAYAPDKDRIRLDSPHKDCEVWQKDPTQAEQKGSSHD
jgi:hypothetical protein